MTLPKQCNEELMDVNSLTCFSVSIIPLVCIFSEPAKSTKLNLELLMTVWPDSVCSVKVGYLGWVGVSWDSVK